MASCELYSSARSPDNLGLPYPYLYQLPLALPCLAISPLSPKLALTLELGLIGAFAAAGAAALSRTLRRSTGVGSEAAAGALYVGSPLFVNELVAGHLLYLIAAAALPHALAGIIRANQEPNKRTVVATALWIAFGLIQIQFVEIIVLCALVAAAAYRAWKPLVALLVLVGLIETPFIVATIVARTPAFLGADVVLLHWLNAQSLSANDALTGFGYFAGYAEHALGIGAEPVVLARLALAAIAIIALAAGYVSRRAGIVLTIPALANVLLVTGSQGPLGSQMEWAFTHLPALAVFRELYHLVAMPTLWEASVAPAAFVSLRPRAVQPLLVIVVVVAASPLAWIVSGAVLRGVPSLASADAAAWRRAVETIADDRSNSSVLLVPNLQPLGPPGTAGVDPEALAIGRHPVLYQFQPDPVVAWALGLWRAGDVQTLSRLGIAFVAQRNDWESQRFENLEPALRELAPACYRVPRSHAQEPVSLGRIAPAPNDFRVRRPPALYVGLPRADAVTDDPRLGWVRGERWSGCFASLAELPTPTLFTLGARPLHVSIPPGADRLMVWAPGGARIANGIPSTVRADSFVPIRASDAARVLEVRPLGPTAITGFFSSDETPRWWATTNLDPTGRWQIIPTRTSAYIGGTNTTPGAFPDYRPAVASSVGETPALRLVQTTIVLAWTFLAVAAAFVAVSYAGRAARP